MLGVCSCLQEYRRRRQWGQEEAQEVPEGVYTGQLEHPLEGGRTGWWGGALEGVSCFQWAPAGIVVEEGCTGRLAQVLEQEEEGHTGWLESLPGEVEVGRTVLAEGVAFVGGQEVGCSFLVEEDQEEEEVGRNCLEVEVGHNCLEVEVEVGHNYLEVEVEEVGHSYL